MLIQILVSASKTLNVSEIFICRVGNNFWKLSLVTDTEKD